MDLGICKFSKFFCLLVSFFMVSEVMVSASASVYASEEYENKEVLVHKIDIPPKELSVNIPETHDESSDSTQVSHFVQPSKETALEVDKSAERSLDSQGQAVSREEEMKKAVDSTLNHNEETQFSELFDEHTSPSIDESSKKIEEPVTSSEGIVASRRSRRDLSTVSTDQPEEEQVASFDEKTFDEAIDQYIDHATEEELGFVIDSSNEKELTDALEYLLLNQLDESFGVEEFNELKKFLTVDQIERLENEQSLEAFEQLLTQYYNEREQKLEEASAFYAFFSASTDEEIDRMLDAKDEQALEQVIAEISASRTNQTSGTRKKRALPLPIAIPFLVKGAAWLIGLGTAAYSSHKIYSTLEARRAEKKRMAERWRYHEQQAQKRHQLARQARAKAVARAKQQAAARAKAQATQRARAQAAVNARKQSQNLAKHQVNVRARARATASARRKSNASYDPPITRQKPATKTKAKAPTKPVVKSETKSKITKTAKTRTHKVRAGESVWSISHKYGISMDDFVKWNKIKNNLIHPDQQVIVSQPESTSKQASKPSVSATYKVKPGDSVWGICEKHGLSVSKFVQWNKIKNNTIHPGQVLYLQEPKPVTKSVPKAAPKSSPTANTTYTVKAGDSVWGIANMHGISMNDLVNWNNIKNNLIHPGQKLTIKQPASSNSVKVPVSGTTVTHRVSYGESLWFISSKYGITVDELRKQNGIKGDLIHPGQVLVVKKGTTTSHTKPTGKNVINYTVKAGDSVWLIANRYGVSMDDLVKWNKIKNYTIHPGQVLTIQKIVSTSTKPAITTTPKVEAKPAITTTPKAESKPGMTTTPKVDEKLAITTTPKVEDQPVITIVPKTESEVLVEKASGSVDDISWNLNKNGAIINGRKYSRHALERMAPDTPDIRAQLHTRAQEIAKGKGYVPGTREYNDFIKKYIQPRNVPPSVIEDAITNGVKTPGNQINTWKFETGDVTVIINDLGDVITVIPK